MPQTRRLALILQQSSSGNHRPQPNNGDCHRTPPLHSATRPASSATSHRASPSRPDGRGQSRRWTRPALPTNFTPCQERHCYHAAPIPRIIADLESSSARLYTGSEMVEAEAHAQAFTTASPDAPPSEQHPAITGATSGIATLGVTWQYGTMLPFGCSDVYSNFPHDSSKHHSSALNDISVYFYRGMKVLRRGVRYGVSLWPPHTAGTQLGG